MPSLDLGRFGLEPADVARILVPAVGCGPGDLLLAGGTLVEGIGNSRSDLDLCLISPRAPPGLDAATNRAFVIDGRLVADLFALHPETLEMLAEKLLDASRSHGAALKHFPYFDLRLLHRIANSVPLNDEGCYDPLLRSISTDALARVKFSRARSEGRALQLDLAGLRDDREWPSMIVASQDLLGWAVDALLALQGITNPTPKWRAKLLAQVPPATLATVPGYGAQSPVSLFLDLNRAPAALTPSTVLRHASRIAGFARSLFLAGEQALLGAPAPSSFPCLLPPDLGQAHLPTLDLDVDFSPAEGGYELFRINSATARIRLTPSEMALACQFDGCPPRRSASAPPAREAPPELVRSLADRLQGSGLAVASPIDEGELEDLLQSA